MSEVLLVPIVFATSCLAAIIGMGGGVLLIVLMPGLVPTAAIIPLHAMTQFASNASRAAFGWRNIDRSIILPIMMGAMAGAWLGSEIYGALNMKWLPTVIGFIILLFIWVPLPSIPGSGKMPLILLGFYQTGLGMLAGATGPVGAAVFLRRNSGRDWLVVNTAVLMTINHAFRLLAFVTIGFSFIAWWKLLSAMMVAGVCGSWVGTKLRGRLPQMDFQRIFRWVVTLLALRLIAMPTLS